MSKFKLLAGLLVLLGIPAAVGWMFAGAGLGYAHRHIHYESASWKRGDTTATVVAHDYMHSTAAIIAISGALAVAWIVISILMSLLGGAMIANRDKSWD